MRNEDAAGFKELMTAVFAMYEKSISSPVLRIYWSALVDYSLADIQRAASMHAKDPDAGMFLPKPANFIRHIDGPGRATDKQIKDKAQIAWSVIMGELGRVGSSGTLKMDDKQALAAVKALGGWFTLCRSTTDQLVWMKKEFIGIYETYEHADPLTLPDKLPGLIDMKESRVAESLQALASKVKHH